MYDPTQVVGRVQVADIAHSLVYDPTQVVGRVQVAEIAQSFVYGCR